MMGEDVLRNRFLLFGYLVQGVLPFEQWACVFNNAKFRDSPGLICKAFSVWFPTMREYLDPSRDIAEIVENPNDDELEEVLGLIAKLRDYYAHFLSPFSREEQLFIYDRRLQNVHGKLSLFRTDKILTHYYCGEADKIISERIEADDYHEIMKVFYPQMQANELKLREKLVTAERFVEFCEFYRQKLRIEPNLIPLAQRLGVFGAA